MNAVEKLPAVSHLFFLVPTGKQTIVANSDKTFREYMHQKHSQKLCSFDGLLDIFTTIFVILYGIGNGLICHTDNSMITDSDTMSVTAKVPDHRIGSIECLFRIYNPILFVDGIQ